MEVDRVLDIEVGQRGRKRGRDCHEVYVRGHSCDGYDEAQDEVEDKEGQEEEEAQRPRKVAKTVDARRGRKQEPSRLSVTPASAKPKLSVDLTERPEGACCCRVKSDDDLVALKQFCAMLFDERRTRSGKRSMGDG